MACLFNSPPPPSAPSAPFSHFSLGGSNVTFSTDGTQWANVSFDTRANVPVEIAFVVPVNDCGETAASVAQCTTSRLANSILSQVPAGDAGPALLRRLHQAAWEKYWGVMQARGRVLSTVTGLSRARQAVAKRPSSCPATARPRWTSAQRIRISSASTTACSIRRGPPWRLASTRRDCGGRG